MKWRRMRLRRHDGAIYLDRWGFEGRLGGLFLHRMDAPDPGLDLHDHPWWFASLVIAGGYTEVRADTRAQISARHVDRRRGTVRAMRLDECHSVVQLHGRRTWTIVLHGPSRRLWGFYTPTGFMTEADYDEKVRPHRRDLWNEEPAPARKV